MNKIKIYSINKPGNEYYGIYSGKNSDFDLIALVANRQSNHIAFVGRLLKLIKYVFKNN